MVESKYPWRCRVSVRPAKLLHPYIRWLLPEYTTDSDKVGTCFDLFTSQAMIVRSTILQRAHEVIYVI